jgi:dTDP-4-amino-4,6-dideoxygalactose transaminase
MAYLPAPFPLFKACPKLAPADDMIRWVVPGYKYNMTDVAAAMCLAQLARANETLERRREIAWQYNAAFSGRAELQTPLDRDDCGHSWHLYILHLNQGVPARDRPSHIWSDWCDPIGAVAGVGG